MGHIIQQIGHVFSNAAPTIGAIAAGAATLMTGGAALPALAAAYGGYQAGQGVQAAGEHKLGAAAGHFATGALAGLGAYELGGMSAPTSTTINALGASAPVTTTGGGTLSTLGTLGSDVGAMAGGGGGGLGGYLKTGLGVYGYLQNQSEAAKMRGLAAQAQAQANPLSPYQTNAASELAALNANPSSITSSPLYESTLSAGEQAIRRELAARGMTDSGAGTAALGEYAAQLQDQMYQQQVGDLQSLATTGALPAAELGLQGQYGAMSLQNTGINQLSQGLGSFGIFG